MNTDEIYKQFLEWRGIETPCPVCCGSGQKAYSSTATWRGGMGGNACTQDVCNTCWGSGDRNHPWAKLKLLRNSEDRRIREGALNILANSAGATLNEMHPAVEEICKELDKLARGRKPRPAWFQNACISLAKNLRQGVANRAALELAKALNLSTDLAAIQSGELKMEALGPILKQVTFDPKHIKLKKEEKDPAKGNGT
jgi:hypothetical protein